MKYGEDNVSLMAYYSQCKQISDIILLIKNGINHVMLELIFSKYACINKVSSKYSVKLTFIVVLFVYCYVVFHFLMFFFNNYASLRYIFS